MGTLLLLASCQHTELASPIHNGAQGLEENAQYGQVHESQNTLPESEITHMVNFETPYYTEGPQQARPADGTFAVGTRVKLLEPAGSYAFVITESGVKGYVLASDLESLNQP